MYAEEEEDAKRVSAKIRFCSRSAAGSKFHGLVAEIYRFSRSRRRRRIIVAYTTRKSVLIGLPDAFGKRIFETDGRLRSRKSRKVVDDHHAMTLVG